MSAFHALWYSSFMSEQQERIEDILSMLEAQLKIADGFVDLFNQHVGYRGDEAKRRAETLEAARQMGMSMVEELIERLPAVLKAPIRKVAKAAGVNWRTKMSQVQPSVDDFKRVHRKLRSYGEEK